MTITAYVPDGARVRYHGSKTQAHGDDYTMARLCTCRACWHRPVEQGVRYRLVGDDGLVIRHVRRESFTVL